MSRRARSLAATALTLTTLCGAFGSSVLAAPAGRIGAAHASACTGRKALALHLHRLHGPRAQLSWHIAGAAAASSPTYRVERAGKTVGQTTGRSMVLRITPGRKTVFTVEARWPGLSCSSTLHAALPFLPPGAVSKLKVLRRTSSGAVIAWKAARRGDASLAGYRVERDGAVVGQTHSVRFAVKLSPGRSHRLEVLAVDTRGDLGAPSRTLLVPARAGATPASTLPAAPTGLAASEVSTAGATVSWIASAPGSAPIAAYRVYRDGHLLGQTSQTSMRILHLSFPHTYAITVAAVDTAKREGLASATLSLTTNHSAPRGPSRLAASSVTDSSATLSWDAGEATSGTLTGYELFKDGAAVGVIHGQSATVALASERSYTFTVRALDSAGFLSAPSPSVEVRTTHTPPSTPGSLHAIAITSTSATVSWSPSTPVSGNIVGYRVFRDGLPYGQVEGTQVSLEDLAPSTSYEVTVVAVDSLGAISAPAGPLTVTTAEPVPTHGTAQAFLLATTDASFHDLEAHYQQIGVVYPTDYECGSGGTVTGKDDPLVTGWAVARKIAVLPRLNCQNVGFENQILNEPRARENEIEKLAALCREYDYQGIQLDFEGAAPSEREPFTQFNAMLAERLHAQGDKLSTVVTAKYYNIMTGRAAMYDDAALSNSSDWLFVLDWGLHWTTSTPGPLDEYAWFKKVAEYTATMPNRSKFVLGMPMYGLDWANGGGPSNPATALEYSNIVALEAEYPSGSLEWNAADVDPHFSYTDSVGVHHDVWFTERRSIGARLELAESLGLGLGLWHLGSEDQSVWELPQLNG